MDLDLLALECFLGYYATMDSLWSSFTNGINHCFLTIDISPYAAAILSYKMPDGKAILLLITQEKQ